MLEAPGLRGGGIATQPLPRTTITGNLLNTSHHLHKGVGLDHLHRMYIKKVLQYLKCTFDGFYQFVFIAP